MKILDNAIKQCKNDGYILYSTCAINPLENEAVVCYIMEKYKDEIEIINCGKKLREMNIKFREGLVKWKVCVGVDKNNKYIWEEKYENVKDKYDLIVTNPPISHNVKLPNKVLRTNIYI